MAPRNISVPLRIVDHPSRTNDRRGTENKKKLDDYSLVGSASNDEGTYSTLVHDSLNSASKKIHPTVCASNVLPDEYQSIGKTMSSSLQQLVRETDPVVLHRSVNGGSSRPTSPPPPLPPPIAEKHIPHELFRIEDRVTDGTTKQAFCCNSVEVETDLSQLEHCDITEVFMMKSGIHTQEETDLTTGKECIADQKQDVENGSGMELYMNVNVAYPPIKKF